MEKGVEVARKLIFDRKVEDAVWAERMAICESNQCGLYYLTRWKIAFCGTPDLGRERDVAVEGCGCVLAGKTWLADAECPCGLWRAEGI